ncbi:MAG: hypothetical protein Q9M40_02355 [Sulfurimonas sp.]|nr:hypothetical protein [Sulfurimonas sp.]
MKFTKSFSFWSIEVGDEDMNQINPLHLGGLLLVILIFVISHLSTLKDELVEVKAAYKESEKLAVDLSALKNVYANKEKIKKSINRILMQSNIKKCRFIYKKRKEFYHYSAQKV